MRHPIHGMPFDEPIENALAEEYAARPLGERMQALRKAAGRELAMLLGGQAAHRVERVPPDVRSMLWVYTWTTVGDAIMDLAPRSLVPPSISIDLLIAPTLALLFAHDPRFRDVHTSAASFARRVDFVLLDTYRTTSLRIKAAHLRRQPFAAMRGHHAGERFDRVAFADRRVRQLFGLGGGAVVQPTLDLDAPPPQRDAAHCVIAVPLGARVERKRYAHWSELLCRIVGGWPKHVPPPRFRFLGVGPAARADLGAIDPRVVAEHGQVLLDSGDLRKTALDLASSDVFLGVDGGLMHIAVAVGIPGVALFADIHPAYFLRPESTMHALRSPGDVSALAPAAVAAAFLAKVEGRVGAPRAPGRAAPGAPHGEESQP